ncbi:MAG: helical backbone metal receptor [Bacteroidales bacterium]|nr:helical backbone metal receptor [Bacteroidales bacterium]
MKNKIILIGVILFLTAAVSCQHGDQQSQQRKATDSLRIVSLTPSITKQLLLLDVEDYVIGHTSYCPSDSLENSEMVASATEVNVEKIATLNPDVVLVSTLTKQQVIDNLRKLGIEVEYLDMPKSFEEICDQMITIGKIVNREDRALTIVEKQRTLVNSLQNRIPEGEKLKFFIEIGANPLYAATSESFMHDYIRFANGENIAAGLKSGTMSRESVIAKNPDVIVIVTMGLAGKEEKQIWQEYPNLNAAKKDNIFIIDPDQASSPTPVSFTNVLEKIIERVYNNQTNNN